MPPELRQRTAEVKPGRYGPEIESSPRAEKEVNKETSSKIRKVPPTYTIDLSLPPSKRYEHVARDFKPAVGQLTPLFDEIVGLVGLPVRLAHLLAWIFLRRLCSNEQTEELRGMSDAFAVPMYLLIAYNILLDLLMGCTSGGIMAEADGITSMVHFRTLDWGMPVLRKALVQLHFVNQPDGDVIARTVGYAGYVGVLTGVKQNLSISLNFRPYHNAKTWSWDNVRYYGHLLLVLLGYRPSVSALLRDFLIPRMVHAQSAESQLPSSLLPRYSIGDVSVALPQIPSTACYMTLCTGVETMVLEKDLDSAITRHSFTFLSTTNHDASTEASIESTSSIAQNAESETSQHLFGIGMQELIEDSLERKVCLTKRWEAWQSKQQNEPRDTGETRTGVSLADLQKWMLEYPVTNDETHFTCIMDPRKGEVTWVRAFEEGEIEARKGRDRSTTK